METSIIVGYGEIGKSLHQVIGPALVHDPEFSEVKTTGFDVMHICFPPSDSFVKDVKAYQKRFRPNLTIIYSTVPIGTTLEIGGMTVHSPVEGRHPELAEGIKAVRWIGGDNFDAVDLAVDFWRPRANHIESFGNSKWTEFLKLRSTSKYAINIAWTEYEAKVAEELGLDYSFVQDFDSYYNEIYRDDPRIQRYILSPPNGKIGGHCLIPNAKILNKQYPDSMLDKILELE